jgi:tetratricopeptide (TPR) repeat protein
MRMARLTQELDLDEAGAAKLFPLVNRHDEKVSALADERIETIHKLDAALHAEKEDTAALTALLDKLNAGEHAIHEADEALHTKVRDFLTPAQVARFVIFHEHFHEEVRALLDDARREPPRAPAAPGKAFQDMMGHAMELAKANDLAGAVAHVDRAIALEPKSADAHVFKAQLLVRLNHPDEALREADRALELDPRSAGAYLTRGHLKREWHKLEDAAADASAGIWIDPSRGELWILRAAVRLEQGRLKEAYGDADKAIELDAHDADALRMRLHVTIALQDAVAARADLERLATLSPDNPHLPELRKAVEAIRH